MKNRFLWEHLRSPELKELAEKDAIVIMPVGAIEQHGPHLPVNTDLITARWLSQLVAERLDAQGLPVIIAPEFFAPSTSSVPGVIPLMMRLRAGK